MKLGVYIFLVGLAATGQAYAESPSLHVWTDGILSRLPFQNGSLDHDGYRGYANSFVEDKKRYFDGVFGRLLDKAVRNGMTARADALRQDHERRIRDLTVSADLATESVFSALDHDRDGVVRRAEARSAIYGYASAADLDNDGYLDADEQALAEWALSTGNVIAAKADEAGLERQFREMERASW
ncbi:hypothetical protein OIU34_18925 [Pararhizobium sp. BT-229]|uniref:hypothetical protein n=1 Tax=Pararhizobium sp. BT-229 TaxID=2986923 RepID=UPI0021F73FE0|nr:hypothetical protein [Pararhizobium sp. BT-229]MCV9963955.1 hypothetical protein [Pararhizobium sp. BT-229]